MLLAIDIGNTNIALGIFNKNRLTGKYSIPTHLADHSNELRKIIHKYPATTAMICSVVPQATEKLVKDLKKNGINNPVVLGDKQKVPIKNLYRFPKQVGQDRLVNAYAAIQLYGYPAIVIDFGTAITFDVISRKQEYLGGMIIPGLGISLSGLAEKTALLPSIKLSNPKELIGRDTRNSILSGVIYGFSTLADGVTAKIQHQLNNGAIVIGTGGNINLIAKYCKSIQHTDINLTLKGINLISNS